MPLPKKTNLIAHWKMNDNNSNTIVADSIGYHNGIWQHGNTSSDSVSGKINSALNFDGWNDYVVVDDSDAFDIPVFSFCAWLKHSTNNIVWDRIASKKIYYYDYDGYEISLDGGNTDVLYTSGAGPIFATTSLGINWLDSNWHHLVVIYDNINIKVYCDNVLKTTSGTINSVVGNANSFILGKVVSESTTMWDGVMDDVRFYNIALTSYEVNSLYNFGNGTESEGDPFRPFISFVPGQSADG